MPANAVNAIRNRAGGQSLLHSASSAASSKSSLFLTVALTIATLYFGRQIFIPLASAVVLSFVLTPVVALVERTRMGRAPAVVVVLVLCFALTAVTGWIAAGQLIEIAAHISDYKANLQEKIQSLHSQRDGALGRAADTVRQLNTELTVNAQNANSASGRVDHPARPIPVQVTAPPSSMVQDLRALLGPLAGPMENTAIVVIFTAFTLTKREDLRNRLIRLGGQGQLTAITEALDDASHRLSRYLVLQFLVNVVYGIIFGVGLYLIHIPHALLWGALAAVLRLVPYIGTWIAAAFPIAVAMATFPGWSHAVLSLGLFLILELSIANMLEPWLYGSHTGISALAILVAAVFWTMLWGPAGLILSTPLTVCLMLLGRYVPQLDFLEVLLGDEPVLKPEEHFYQRLLAMDQEEARVVAENYLQENSHQSLYETVLVPALRLAEEDRHMGVLDDRRSGAILQGARELLEDLLEDSEARAAEDRLIADRAAGNGFANEGNGNSIAPDRQFAAARIACIPARDDADELVGMMLTDLLRQAGNNSSCISIGAVDDMLAQVQLGGFQIICVSALPPFAVGQARSLCKRLRARFPDLAIIVGLWQFVGGVPKAQERVSSSCSDAVATSLSEALLQIRRLAQSPPPQESLKTPVEKAVNRPAARQHDPAVSRR
jgi:predicted PurR-regulated permease PerM